MDNTRTGISAWMRYLVKVCIIYLIVAVISGAFRIHTRIFEAQAIGILRNFSSEMYSIHNSYGGFPGSFALIERLNRIGGHRWNYPATNPFRYNGYEYTYIPGLIDEEGFCTTYSIIARPIDYEYSTCRSFHSDESGSLRFTWMDRAPCVADQFLE